jgi:hypothetical protein
MSRSYRHVPIHGLCNASDKQGKRQCNRNLRRITRQTLHTHEDLDSIELPRVRDVSDTWLMPKDGKAYWHNLADFSRTLKKIVRSRDGRLRQQLVLTSATHAAREDLSRRRRHYLSYMTDAQFAAHDARFTTIGYLCGLRK